MSHIIAVIDLGKTNSKVAMVDTSTATELAVITKPAATKNEQYPCLDHHAIEKFILDALQSLASEHDISGITVTTHGATAALVNAAGDLVLPVMDYEFQGVDECRDEYNIFRPPYSETGSPASPGGLNIGAQIFWQQKHYPDAFAKTQYILTWPQYWIQRLGGEICNDLTSLGAHSDLLNPYLAEYSTLVSKMNWSHLMPSIATSGKHCGSINAAVSKQTGLARTTPLFVGIHDSNASLVPHLFNHQGPFSVVSTGTWFISMAIGSTATNLDESRDVLVNVNALGHSVPTAKFMGGRERELMSVSASANENTLDKLLARRDQNAYIMPSVVNDTGPFPNMSSNWQDCLNSCNEDIFACKVSLYLANVVHECLGLISSLGPIYIEGPLASDGVFTQMLQVLSNRSVLLSNSVTGTSVGAAMLIKPAKNSSNYNPVQVPAERKILLLDYSRHWNKKLLVHSR